MEGARARHGAGGAGLRRRKDQNQNLIRFLYFSSPLRPRVKRSSAIRRFRVRIPGRIPKSCWPNGKAPDYGAHTKQFFCTQHFKRIKGLRVLSIRLVYYPTLIRSKSSSSPLYSFWRPLIANTHACWQGITSGVSGGTSMTIPASEPLSFDGAT